MFIVYVYCAAHRIDCVFVFFTFEFIFALILERNIQSHWNLMALQICRKVYAM